MQPKFFQKFHFAFIFHFPSGTDFQLIYRGAGLSLVPVNLAGTRLAPHFFHAGLYVLHHIYIFPPPPSVPWLDHVHPSSSRTVSRATLQFPDNITCSPSVPWLYHLLPSSSQTVLRATLQFPQLITCPQIPSDNTWRGKLSLFSSFVLFQEN